MDNHFRILLLDGIHQFANASGGAQAAMIFDTEQDLFTGHIENLAYFFHIKFIGMLRAGGKTDTRLKNLPGLLNIGQLFNRKNIRRSSQDEQQQMQQQVTENNNPKVIFTIR